MAEMAEYDSRRQSAPRDTPGGFLSRMFGGRKKDGVTPNEVLGTPVGRERVANATTILQRYMGGKTSLNARIIANEEWYKIRHWNVLEGIKKSEKGDKIESSKEVRPGSGWLFNVIVNKHADAMDNYPAPVILPREEGDEEEAKTLSCVVPFVLEQTDFEQVYSDVQLYKLKSGTGVYAVMWDPKVHSGLGDIKIKKVDLLNLFWEPGISNIQDSPNLFHVYSVDNELLISEYPQLKGKLGGKTITTSKYRTEDGVDDVDKSTVVEWYYKRVSNGRTVLHYCKYVGETVLYATENEPEPTRSSGLYDHGRYPFIFDVVFPIEGSPAGFGFIDVGKDAQEYIDRGKQAIYKNMLWSARPRFFTRKNGTINEEELKDLTKEIVHCEGNVGEDSIRVVTTMPLPEVYVTVINNTIDELKETTGNRDISTGGTTSGVTAASAIAAMQEAGAKLTRDINKGAYRAYKKIVLDVIDLMRQFYDTPRNIRITGKDGKREYAEYTNEGLRPVEIKDEIGEGESGYRLPEFDIKVGAEKASPYSKMAQNELAFEVFGKGFFNPELADQALGTLQIMDLDQKEKIIEIVSRNATLYQKVQMLQETVVSLNAEIDRLQGGGGNAKAAASLFGGSAPPMPASSGDEGGSSFGEEPSNTAKARERVAQSTAVR